MTTAKRRPRRIAADEAHAWARNLRLNNPTAKLVLSMLTLYVDGDGTCFVGIPTLAEDVELSPQTVRDRLSWLERVGAIVRTAQWVDSNGHRNGEGRGRRTSDLIRLVIEDEEVEERAAAMRARRADPIPQTGSNQGADPIQGIGSNSAGDSADPAAPLQRPYDSAEGLISEPEPEPEQDSPPSPSGGASAPSQADEQGEPEHFAEAWQSWPGHQAMRRDLALAEFRKLSPDKRRLCRAAIPHFFKMQQHLKRDHIPNFHIWVRSGGFNEFPSAALDEAKPQAVQAPSGYDVATREGLALKSMHAFARKSMFEHRGRVSYSLPVTAPVLAFVDVPPERDWHWIDSPPQLAAWSAFLSAHIVGARPDLTTTRKIDNEIRRGFMAPWRWPPRKDGTISTAAGESE